MILPALSSGRAVLCDRFVDATTAYQGYSRGIEGATVDALNAFAARGAVPDLTFLLDVTPEQGFARIRGRAAHDRIESESIAFHRRVREGYLALAGRHPDRIVLLDAARPADDVFRDVLAAASARLGW